MELLTLPQLAEAAAVPVSAARYFRDRFILFVPSIRVGKTVLHPEEAIETLKLINSLAAEGASATEIENELERAFPVTVVTSQGVSAAQAELGSAGVIRELAQLLDERGERVQDEIGAIREQVESVATTTQLEGVVFETRLAAQAINERVSTELYQVKTDVADLRAQLGSLASRDQLEWIGDVVSAAISRSPGTGPSGSIEKRLIEIHEELQRPRPSDDVAELRVAVDRLAEHVNNRDREFQRTLHGLVNVMRTEIRSLQSEMRSTSFDRPLDLPLMAATPMAKPLVAPVPEKSPVRESDDETSTENGKSRAPRRLGHLNRHQDAAPLEIKPTSGVEESA